MISTYAELPLGLPESLDRALVRVDGVETVSKNPGRHDECLEIGEEEDSMCRYNEKNTAQLE